LLKDKFDLKKKVSEVGIESCFIFEITVAELAYGAYKSTNYRKHIAEVEDIEKLFTIVPIYDCLKLFGEEKARLNGQGIRIPGFDLLIGTTAVHNQMIMVTNNEKHMMRINGIQLENWTK
jgi:tRNA(fMet)-specific endonuclease VapC